MKLTVNQMLVLHEWNEKRGRNEMLDNSQQKQSQNRMDSIIALMMEEAKTVLPDKRFTPKTRIYHVLTKVHVRVTKIMRTMRE